MKKVNSISGGQTSAYISANYPADFDVFALVRTNDKTCLFPDKKIRQIVSDKIGQEFIGTLEQDDCLKYILQLEQMIGRNITFVTGEAFEDIINHKKNQGKNGSHYLPNMMTRYCTSYLKMFPIFEWWFHTISEPIEMRIGFRANEMKRAKKVIQKLDDNGMESMKYAFEFHKNGNKKWKNYTWRKPTFPLIDDAIYKDHIQEYWNDKPVKFSKKYKNNCVGCFHRNELYLNKMSNEHPNKMKWFSKMEELNKPNTFRKGVTYKEIINYKPQIEMSFDDFNECDSGYCGL